MPFWEETIVPELKARPGLRARLRIPEDHTVFCSFGGEDSFNTPWVQQTVCELGASRQPVWFLFANHRPFCESASLPAQVLHLSNLATTAEKEQFIHSCDAMLHARLEGETFGLAVAEFSQSDKPVFVCSCAESRTHIRILPNPNPSAEFQPLPQL